MDRPQRLSSEGAKRLILLILADGYVEPTDHCLQRMKERGITMPQLLHGLKTGEVGNAVWSDEYENWKYTVVGIDTEGDELTAPTVIVQEDLTLVVLTAY
jgi:hypothetical protein